MKKIAGILVLFLIALAFVGCQPSAKSAEPAVFNEEDVLEDLEITRYNYQYEFYGRTVYAECFEVENTSTFNIALTGEFHYFDESQSLISVGTRTRDVLGPNQKTVLSHHQETPYSNCELKLSVSLEEERISAASKLSYEVTQVGNKLIIAVTNNSDQTAEFVSAFVFYFKDGQVVDQDSMGLFDVDHEFKPGKTITEEFAPATVEFDSYKVYLHGQIKQ